jgi:type IV secretion system protein VirB10
MTEIDPGAERTAKPSPAKVDPETLAIRARPARAIRFKRGVIIGVAALGSASLMTVAWLALKPPSFRHAVQPSELSEPNSRAASEALGRLPAGYGDAPKLGPPLPGDLGRPILKAQREMATETGGPAQDPSVEMARQQRRAEVKAARQSGLLVPMTAGDRSAAAVDGGQVSTVAPASATAATPAASQDLGHQQRKIDFASRVDVRGDINPHRLAASPSPYTLVAGSVIAASLITGLNSDLPGLVTAQVTENVYDSATGRTLLVPQGARLIGGYDSVVAFGQKRALIVWKRIILPDGSSLRIDNAPATDVSGYAGLADKVDFHSWTLLKGVVIATLLGVGSELSIDGESDLVEAIRESTQTNVARAGDQLTARNLDIQPTIIIRPGAPVRLVVHHDLILAPWRG